MTKLNLFVGAGAFLTLAACFSSGSGSGSGSDPMTPPTVTPQASTGFAVAGETDRAGVTFTIRGARSFEERGDYTAILANGGEYEDEDGNEVAFSLDSFELGSQSTVIELSDDENSATLTINGNTYELTRVVDPDEPGDIIFNFVDSDAIAEVSLTPILDFELAANSDVVIAVGGGELTSTGATSFLDVIGFDTGPSTIAANTGSVTYSGNLFLVGTNANDLGPDDGSDTDPDAPIQGVDLDGTVMLTADFDGNSISGTALISNEDDVMPQTETLTFENASITGNGFSGNLTSDDQFFDEGVTFGDVTYDGNFYGSEGNSVAGGISGELLVEGADPVLMLGVFGAENTTTSP